MDVSNGTRYTIAGVPVTIIGKTGDGRIITQAPSGLQVDFSPTIFERLVDKQ